MSVREEAACSCEIYEHFATFLCFTYKKNGDKHLAISSIRAVWGGVIHLASQRFKASTCPETKVRPLLWRARLLLLLLLRACALLLSPPRARACGMAQCGMLLLNRRPSSNACVLTTRRS